MFREICLASLPVCAFAAPCIAGDKEFFPMIVSRNYEGVTGQMRWTAAWVDGSAHTGGSCTALFASMGDGNITVSCVQAKAFKSSFGTGDQTTSTYASVIEVDKGIPVGAFWRWDRTRHIGEFCLLGDWTIGKCVPVPVP